MKNQLLIFAFTFFTCYCFSQTATTSRADSLWQRSEWKSAIPLYESYLKSSPDDAVALNRLGMCYHNTGEYDKALKTYLTFLKKKPSAILESMVRIRVARIYSRQGQLEKAGTFVQQALNLGYANVTELETDADFANLRKRPNFKPLLELANKNAFPCLTIKQARDFDFWIGDWDVYAFGGNAIVGQSKIEMASGGCMILEHWTAVGGPAPNTGKSMNYINSATGKWEQLWIGSGGLNTNNPQKFVDGEYKDNAMRFTFEQVTPQGQKQIGRFIFFNEGADQVRQFNEVSSDEGKTWATSYNLVYKRKKA